MSGQLIMAGIVVAFVTLYVWYRSVMRPPSGAPAEARFPDRVAPDDPSVAVAFAAVRPAPGAGLDTGAMAAAGVPAAVAADLGALARADCARLLEARFAALGGPVRIGAVPWVVVLLGTDTRAALGAVAGAARAAGRAVVCAAPGFPGGLDLDARDPVGGVRRAFGATAARSAGALVTAPFAGVPSDAELDAVLAALVEVAGAGPAEVLLVTSDASAPVSERVTGLVLDTPVGAALLGLAPVRPIRFVGQPRLVPYDPAAFVRGWLG